MTDRPIIFSAPMVRALLDGRKTQTRRVLKPRGYRFFEHPVSGWRWEHSTPKHGVDGGGPLKVEYLSDVIPYAIGDRLWVRENWRISTDVGEAWPAEGPCVGWLDMQAGGEIEVTAPSVAAISRAGRVEDWDFVSSAWRPSIHMPRWAARLTLTVTDVRVQRLHDLSCADAIAEGIQPSANSQTIDCDTPDPRHEFRGLWDSLHGAGAWNANPWIVALTFTVDRRNIDA